MAQWRPAHEEVWQEGVQCSCCVWGGLGYQGGRAWQSRNAAARRNTMSCSELHTGWRLCEVGLADGERPERDGGKGIGQPVPGLRCDDWEINNKVQGRLQLEGGTEGSTGCCGR